MFFQQDADNHLSIRIVVATRRPKKIRRIKLRILVADDHDIIRRGLKGLADLSRRMGSMRRSENGPRSGDPG